jgi:hypothetical protein
LTLSAVRITPYYPDLRIARLDIEGRTIASVAGAVLRVGERLNIHLKYSPQVPDTAVVRVELDVLLPCPWTYVQPIVLSSYDKRITTIAKVVDTHGTIGSDVTIPITLELVNPQDSIIDATIEYTVRINGRMFDLRSIAPGQLLDAAIASDGWYTIRIVREGITLRTVEPQLLGAITGTGLASRLFRDSVIIASLVVRDVLKQPIVQVRNGVLTLGAYCFPREIVVSQTATSVEVQPNPASSEAVVMLRNVVAGTYVVELTSLSGESLLRYRTELSPSPTWTIPIPLLGMSSGVAVVTVTTPVGTYRTFLVIAK